MEPQPPSPPPAQPIARRLVFHLPRIQVKLPWEVLAELGIIVLWALWVGRAYLDFRPTVWPTGGEFAMSTQSDFIWTLLPRCGACVLWNGFTNGGVPAFVDLHGSALHPLVVIPILIWGGINGLKVTLLASLALAGLAQWWLARALGLGRLARLWSAGLAVTGGHLAARMELGLVAMVLAIASSSLAIAASLDLALHGRRRTAR